MDRIDNIHKGEAAQIFLITIEAIDPPPLYAFTLLDAERQNPNFALASDLRKPSTTEVKNICDKWTMKLKSRCRDLLKVQSSHDDRDFEDCRVDYLHRTMRDWLRDNHLGTLKRQAPEDFHPAISLCRITFARLRYCTDWVSAPVRTWDRFNTELGVCIRRLLLTTRMWSKAQGRQRPCSST